MGSKECKFCKCVVHLLFCPNNREKNKTGVSHTQTKKIWCQGKCNQDKRLITKVKTTYFDNNAFDIQPLQYIDLWLRGNQMKVLVDSVAEMPIIKSNQVPQSFENDDSSKIQLISAFGDKAVMDLKSLSISLKYNTPSFSSCNVDVLFSITDTSCSLYNNNNQ